MVVDGKVEAIFIGPRSREALQPVDAAQAVPGRGLEGDRHFVGQGTFSKGSPENEITLIEIEAIEALRRDYQEEIGPGEARRNVVTRGVALNHLVGREFQVGPVKLLGLKLCEPCSHLASLTSQTVLKGLIHRGGLRAQVLEGGTIRSGDTVRG